MLAFLNSSEWTAVALSLKVSVCAVAIILVPSMLLATWLARSTSRFKTCVDTLIVVPLVLPPVIVGIGLLVLLGNVGQSLAFTWWDEDRPDDPSTVRVELDATDEGVRVTVTETADVVAPLNAAAGSMGELLGEADAEVERRIEQGAA